jgi:hypothetical protein
MPLIEIQKRPDRDTVRVAWPFYTRRLCRFFRHDLLQSFLLPLSITHERRHDDGSRDIDKVRVPFYRYRSRRDGSSDLQSLWPFFLVRGEGVEKCWAPLFRWLKRSRDPEGGSATSVFGRLYQSREGPDGVHRYAELLGFAVEKSAMGWKFGFLRIPSAMAVDESMGSKASDPEVKEEGSFR